MAIPYFTKNEGKKVVERVTALEQGGGGSGGGSLPEVDLKLIIDINPEEMAQGSSWTRTLSDDVIEEINKALSSCRVFVVILTLGVTMPGGAQYAEVPVIAKSLRMAGGTETHFSTMDFSMFGLIYLDLIGDELQINITPLDM